MARKKALELPHLVTRSKVENLVDHSIGWEYLIYDDPEKFREVDRATALDYIDRHGLTLSFSDPNGQAYDSPDRSFFEKYKGYFQRKEEEEKRRLKEACKRAAMTRAKKKLEKRESKLAEYGIRSKANV